MSQFNYNSLPGMDFGQSLGQGIALGQRSLGLRQDQQQFDAGLAQDAFQFDARMRAQDAADQAAIAKVERQKMLIQDGISKGMFTPEEGATLLFRLETSLPVDVQFKRDAAQQQVAAGPTATSTAGDAPVPGENPWGVIPRGVGNAVASGVSGVAGWLGNTFGGGHDPLTGPPNPQAYAPAPLQPPMPSMDDNFSMMAQQPPAAPPGITVTPFGSPSSLSPPAGGGVNAPPPALSPQDAMAQALRDLGPGASREAVKARAKELLGATP